MVVYPAEWRCQSFAGRMLYNWLKNIQSFLYPSTCLLCMAPGLGELDLCEDCAFALPKILNACERCALPLPSMGMTLCGHCQHTPPHYDVALAPLRYTFPVDRLIQRFKFHGQLSTGRSLAHLMADCVAQQGLELPEVLLPVPLHHQKLQARGFNQSLELARYLSLRFNIPIDSHSVIRVKPTQPQMELPLKARKKNIRGAFEVRQALSMRHVAVVDDVVTTGSTVNELARILRQAGVRRIQIWSCARTA